MSGAKPGTDPPQSAGLRTLFYPISIMVQIFTKDRDCVRRGFGVRKEDIFIETQKVT